MQHNIQPGHISIHSLSSGVYPLFGRGVSKVSSARKHDACEKAVKISFINLVKATHADSDLEATCFNVSMLGAAARV